MTYVKTAVFSPKDSQKKFDSDQIIVTNDPKERRTKEVRNLVIPSDATDH